MKEALRNIGFNDIEINIYLELIKIGPQVASIIANRLKINRSSVYSILKTLKDKGLISYYKKDNIKVYSANDPNCLVAYLDRRCRTYDYYKNEILTVIPDIRSLSTEINTLKPIVRYLEGIESINNLLYDIVNTDAPLRAYFGFDCTFNNDLKFFWHTFFDSKVFDLVNVKLILPKSNKIRSFFKQFLNNNFNSLEISYMNIEDFSDNLIFLCSSKVILLNFKSKNEYSVVIESEDIYNFYKTFFDQAWDIFNKK